MKRNYRTVYYEVTGKRFLNDEELEVLLAQSPNPNDMYFKSIGERGLGHKMSPSEFEDLKKEPRWINISNILSTENKALEYAKKALVTNSSSAMIEKVIHTGKCSLILGRKDQSSCKIERILLCELKKENGKVIGIFH